jgi:hypothetical protein
MPKASSSRMTARKTPPGIEVVDGRRADDYRDRE